MGKKLGCWKYVLGIVIALLLSLVVVLNLPITQRYAADYVSKQVTNSLGSYINLKEVAITSFNTAEIYNLVVKDKGDRPFFTAKKVDVKVSIWDLLRGRELAGIEEITITEGVGHLTENQDGRWNYQDFIDEKSPDNSPKFQGTVVLKNSSLDLDLKGKVIEIRDLDATADLKDYSKISLEAKAKVDAAPIQVNGVVGTKENLALNVEGSQVVLSKYLSFLPATFKDKVSIKNGELSNFKLYIVFPKDELSLKGYAKLKNLALSYEDYNLEQGEVLVNFQGANLRFFAGGLINGAKLRLSGTVDNYMQEPKVEANLLSDDFTWQGYNFKAICANLRYAEDKIFVDKLQFNLAGGHIWGKGYYDLANNNYGGQINLEHVALGELPEVAKQGIAGIATASGVVEGHGLDFAGLNFNLTGKVDGGYYQQIPWQEISFNLYKKGEVITLGALNGTLVPGGYITAHGTYEGNNIQGEIFGSKLSLAMVNNYVPQLSIQGSGNFYATLSGTVDNPVAKVIFDATKGSIYGRVFDDLKFRGEVSKQELIIDRASLNVDDRPIYEATGRVDFQQGNLALDIKTYGGRIENILKGLNVNVPLTGNFNNELQIGGTIQKPEVSGSFKLWDGGYQGILLQEISGDYKFINGVLYLPKVNVITPFVQGNVEGSITQRGDFDLRLHGKRIEMSRLPIVYPYPITGVVDFEGTLTGNKDYPIFQGTLTGDKIEFNNQPMTNIKSDIFFRDNLLQVNNFHFNLGEGTFDLNAKYNIENQWIFLVANVKNVDSETALAMADLENNILKGYFNGTAEVTGTLNKPEISIMGNMPKGYLKEFPLQNIEIDLSYADKILKLNKFFGQQDRGKVGAIGEVNFKTGAIKGQLSANDMNPNLFVKLADQDFNVEGVLNGDLQVKGTMDKPDANFSVYLKGNGQQFDQGYILGNLKNSIIYINQGVLSRGTSALKAEGIIPLAAINKSYRQNINQEQNQMNMRMYLENTDLDLLPNFFPPIQWATGKVKGNVVLKGTVAKPLLDGSITTEDAAIKFKDLVKPITDIRGAILFQGQQIKVDDFTGNIGKGYFKVNGGIDLSGGNINSYEGSIIANKLEIESPYYKGLFTGEANISQADIDGILMPKLKVNVDFNNVTVSMPPLPESSDAPLPLMALDINVLVGKNVRAYNPLLYDLYLNGGFSIKGTTDYPQASGEILVKNGTINVLKNIFQVNVGSIKFNQFASYFPTLDFKASTRVARNQIFVSVTGPVNKELTTRLYSEPQMSEADILRLLAFRTGTGEKLDNNAGITENDVLALATMGLQMSFLNGIEDNLRNLLHLDEFRISRDTLTDANRQRLDADSNEVYNIQIGKYISDKVLLKYTRGINYDYNRIGIQYNLNKNIGILGEYDKNDGFGLKVEMQWKF